MSQGERILKYIDENGSITPIEAFSELGITKLATRVGELRQQGAAIIGEWQETENRYGEKVKYMKYRI